MLSLISRDNMINGGDTRDLSNRRVKPLPSGMGIEAPFLVWGLGGRGTVAT